MSSPSRETLSQRVFASPQGLRAWGVTLVILGFWTAWTIWSNASWFHQILFVSLLLTGILLVVKPTWFLHFLILILVGDVSGYLLDVIQIPGFVGFSGIGGTAKLPELLSALGVFHMGLYFLLRPQEFRQPLVKWFVLFVLAGLLATFIGARQYVATNALRDSLGYYFSLFYIMTMVLLPTVREARKTFRLFFYIALLSLIYGYVAVVVTGSSGPLYSAIRAMYYSTCAYFLIAKLFTSPPGTRRWLTVTAILLFSAAMFIGRSRGAVLSFLIGLAPLFFVLRPADRFKVALGVVVPCILVMLAFFAMDARHGEFQVTSQVHGGGDGRTIESFTQMGDAESDPTGSYRLQLWRRAFNGFLESPLVGKGYGWTIPAWSASSQTEESTVAAIIHNSFLHVLACSGLAGFIPLMMIVISYFRLCGREVRRGSELKKPWAACAMGVGINFFLTSLTNVGFELVAGGIMGWVLLALGVRLAMAREDELAVVIPRRAASH